MIGVLGGDTLAKALLENIPEAEPYMGERCEILWVAYDTPIGHDGTPEPDGVLHDACTALDHHTGSVVLSSQLPVGTCARLEALYPNCEFFVCPENLRKNHAVEDWRHQPRIILGVRGPVSRNLRRVDEILLRYTERLLYTDPETAEMTKHAINGFLALSVEYAAEISTLAAAHGADPVDLARCVMSDPRIGERAYLKPHGDAGPHLIREVHTLHALGGGALLDTLEGLCWPA